MANQKSDVGTSGEDALRNTFVEMLFALAVSEVAIHVANLARSDSRVTDWPPAIAHLMLALIVIATSWLGWRQSVSPGMKQHVTYIFSTRFIGLLLDVWLVILYFIVVRSAEIREEHESVALGTPSAMPALGILAIFTTYVVWDIVADIVEPGSVPERASKWTVVRATIVSTAASALCAVLTLAVLWLSQGTSRPTSVVLLDVALLSAVLMFRLLKTWERSLALRLGVSDFKAFAPRQVQGSEEPWVFRLGLAYAVCVLVVWMIK